MQKFELTIKNICLVFLCIIISVSLWDLTIFYIPALVLTGIVGFAKICSYYNIIPISAVVISFFMLLFYEIINFFISAYQPNTILFLRDFILVLCCILLMKNLSKNENYRIYFVIFISLMAGLLALFNIPVFFFKYYESMIYGFDDFSQFRFLYRPLGFLSNDWVTILLCLLPFPVIGLVLFWNKASIRYGFVLILALLIFNLLISFSRAGILAFLLFVLLLNVLFYSHRIVSLKKLLLSNAIFVFAVLLFGLAFSSSLQSSINQSNSHQRSTEGRINQWEQSLTIVRQHPYFGTGSKNYALLGRQNQPMNLENTFTGRVNNTYIQLAIEKGLIGLFLWLSVIGYCVFCLSRQLKKETSNSEKAMNIIILSAIIAIIFRELFFSSLLYNSSILLLFLVLLVFNQTNDNALIKIRKSVVYTSAVLFIVVFLTFYLIKLENALSYANMGLEYERKNNIENAIQCYKKANQLNPTDALFLHNLGRLYEMNNQSDSALYYLTQAVAADPEVAIYHISKGLIIENQDLKKAFEAYKQAILLSPDIIDSQFFKDLKERSPLEIETLLNDVYNALLQVNTIRYSSVIEAKIGKLQLSIEKQELAHETLLHVTRVHSNLSRPWYYLGLIEQEQGNYESMLSYYRVSLFLSPNDHLPLYALAFYYSDIGEEQTANNYFKAAERAWNNKRSVHSSRCQRMYFIDTDKDNVVPNGFLDYITPKFGNNL